MSLPDSEVNLGYVLAKLEGIDERLIAMSNSLNDQVKEHARLRAQLDDYTSQWRAVRWLGLIAITVMLTVKTGDLSALKSIFGSP